jgi:hypothetical protein
MVTRYFPDQIINYFVKLVTGLDSEEELADQIINYFVKLVTGYAVRFSTE